MTYVDRWLREGGSRGVVKARTQSQYRADLADLSDWLQRAGHHQLIEAVTKDVAGRFVSDMVAAGMDRTTLNRKISASSSYWRWLNKRTSITAQPWAGQSLSKATKPGEIRPKRPYDDSEVAALIAGGADQELRDAIHVGALSGMRIEEIYLLTVKDCRGGWFDITKAKTAAGIRKVPIHSGLAAVVARRTAGKAQDDFMFHEAGPPPKPGRERSMPASKRFGYYRKRIGVTDRIPGRRQDRVDFHSLRRWFSTKARQAGIDQATVAVVLGHKVGNITDDVYSGGPNVTMYQACVEAVVLPPGVEQQRKGETNHV
jgi:integrase